MNKQSSTKAAPGAGTTAKPSTGTTLWPLRLGLVLEGWLFLGWVTNHITIAGRAQLAADPGTWTAGILAGVVGLLLVVATWKLKRPGVVGLLVLVAAHVILSSTQPGVHWWFPAAVYLVPLSPVAFYWRRMAWS